MFFDMALVLKTLLLMGYFALPRTSSVLLAWFPYPRWINRPTSLRTKAHGVLKGAVMIHPC